MLHTPIRDVPRGRLYCGPTAVAAITGLPGSVVVKKIRRALADWERSEYGKVKLGGLVYRENGTKKPVRRTGSYEINLVMTRCGYKIKKREYFKKPVTLLRFCEDMGHLGPMIIHLSGHWIALSQGKIVCSYTTYDPVPWQEYKKLGWRVHGYTIFE